MVASDDTERLVCTCDYLEVREFGELVLPNLRPTVCRRHCFRYRCHGRQFCLKTLVQLHLSDTVRNIDLFLIESETDSSFNRFCYALLRCSILKRIFFHGFDGLPTTMPRAVVIA
jgi:hypothetical protein